MAKFTRRAIMQSFMKLLNEMPFDKITVKDIVADCNINRNTFYYNFKDIYDLLDEVLKDELKKLRDNHKEPYHSWSEGLLYAADFALNNKKAVYHLHNSDKKAQFDKYFEKAIYGVVLEFVSEKAQSSEISNGDVDFIAYFYCCGLMGLLNKWLDSGMKEDFNEIICKTGILFDSNMRDAVLSIEKMKRE